MAVSLYGAEEGLSNDMEKEREAVETGDILEVESESFVIHGSLEHMSPGEK